MAIHQRLRELAAATEADPTKEAVWGMAQASWRHAGRDFEMPLFERPVEIEIIARPDPEVRIRPRFVGTSVTLKALDALAPDAALVLRDKPETLVEMLEQHDELSPFTPIGIEQVLSAAGAQRGQLSARSLTGLDDTDSSEGVDAAILPGRWAMSVRRRPESRALRDIECLKNAIEHAPQSECCLTAAVSALLPQATNLGRASARRHLSSIVGAPINIGPTTKPVLIDLGDLFFPRPASSEDVEVVRELSRSDGVVIQASGREERIQALVNIVSHHLALGSRVLVVSRDETALTLLHQKLPPGIRELSVSSTGSDKDVLRNAEVLADRLQSIVDTTNLTELAGQISRLERDIISKRTQTASLDGEIADIIGRHLRLAGPSELPLDLIRGLTTDQAPASWLADRPSCLLFATDPVVAAVEQARAARLRLAERLKHIDDELPEIAALPDVASILRLHDDLRQQAALSSNEGRDEDLALDAIAAFGLDATNRLAVDLDALVAAHRVIADEPWLA
ncbi:MAG: AAA family ATPase, partial [Bradyrhizobium sp.]|nr:AAA family ATPase [Bradyrhizobium sp.]